MNKQGRVEVEVFTKNDCPNCETVKTYLNNLNNVKVTYKNVDESSAYKLEFLSTAKRIGAAFQVPLIRVGTRYVQGSDDAKAILELLRSETSSDLAWNDGLDAPYDGEAIL